MILPKKITKSTTTNPVEEKVVTTETQVVGETNYIVEDKPVAETYSRNVDEVSSSSNTSSDMMVPGEIKMKNTNETWVNTKWRPAMGWMYMTVCICDFILFPILWAVVQFWETQAVNDAFRQWRPLTLEGAGLFHMAMGAVLGIAAWGRSKEKIENKM